MEEKGLLDYWLILYRKRWLILLVMISAMLTAGIVSELLSPVYNSRAVFFVPRKSDVISFLSDDEGTIIRSPLLPEVAEAPHSPYLGILKSKAIKELVIKDFPSKSMDDLRSDVDFALSDEYMIRIDARDTDPVQAADIANAYVHYLNQLIDSYSRSIVSRNEGIIEQQLEAVKAKLREARGTLSAFQENNDAVALVQQKQNLITQKMNYQEKMNAAKIAQKEIQSTIVSLKEQMEKESELYISSELIIGSPLTQSLRSDLSKIEIKMATLKADIKESHPDFVALKKQYEQIKRNLKAEIERTAKSKIKHPDTSYETMRRNLVNHLVEKEKLLASLIAYNTVIDNIEKKILEIPKLLAQQDSLAMDVERYKNMIRTMELKLDEARMQKRRDPRMVVLVEKAVPAQTPSYPNLVLNIVIAGILGLIGGIFYCFFVNYLEETREHRLFKLVRAIEAADKEG
jgi:succinoglycan biosynthesis transport protein ExoP